MLTVEAQKPVHTGPLSKREIIRRLETSAAEFCRLLSRMNNRKAEFRPRGITQSEQA
jgi:hypothetical protein